MKSMELFPQYWISKQHFHIKVSKESSEITDFINIFMILIQNKELDEFGWKEKTMVWRKKKSTEAFRLSLRGGLGRMAV